MEILILGKGFVGSHLAAGLARRGHLVHAADSKECNLLDGSALSQWLESYRSADALIVAAAVTRLRANDFGAFIDNVRMIQNVADRLGGGFSPHVLFISTIDVYGLIPDERPITESFPLAPGDFYAMSKVVGEFILRQSEKDKKFPLTVFRLSGVYSSVSPQKSTVWSMIQSAVQKREISIYGTGEPQRDFVFLDDVVEYAHWALTDRICETVNIATGESHTIFEIAGVIAASLPFEVDVVRRESPPGTVERARCLKFDTEKLRQLFPRIQPTALEDGVRQSVERSSAPEEVK